jgi:lysozyme
VTALDHATALCKRFEGLRLEAYLCPANVPTIGYGATGPGIELGTRWTEQQAEDDLRARLKKLVNNIEATVPNARPHQVGAAASLAYNIGFGAFAASTLLRKWKHGDLDGAAKQFDRWNRAGGRILAGLVKRRAVERRVFEGRA